MDQEQAMAYTELAWADPNIFRQELDGVSPWRKDVLAAMKEGDVAGMASAASPRAEAVLIDVMSDMKSPPQTRVAAAQYVLGQAGHGEIKRVHEIVEYHNMDNEQLTPMIAQRLRKIREIDPTFDMQKLLGGDVIDISAEAVKSEVPEVEEVFAPTDI